MKTLRFSLLIVGVACLFTCVVPGAVLSADAPSDEAASAIIELLGDKDKDIRALGMQQVREGAKGAAATKQFAALLPKLEPNIQVELLGALAARGDKTAREAVLDCLKSNDAAVRTAALVALGPLGEATDVPSLIQKIISSDQTEKNAANTCLTQLCGPSINKAIAGELKEAKPDLRIAIIGILEARRAADCAADILAYVQDSDPRVRKIAMDALGRLAGPSHVAGMVGGVLKAAEKAIMFVCSREKDADRRAAPLLAVWKTYSEDEKTVLLPLLGRIGGSEALKIVEAAMADAALPRREAGIRALCNWPDASIAPKLIDLVKTTKDANYRRLALQALARVAALPDKRSAAERLDMLKTAMTLANADEERNYILKRAKAVRTVESLRFVAPYMEQPAYAQEACTTVVELAHHRALRESSKAEFDKALDVVIRTSKDADVVDRAQRYKKGQTRGLGPVK